MQDKQLKYIIKEALTNTDKNQIGVMIRKEIKDAFGKDLEKKVTNIVDKQLKGTKFEKENTLRFSCLTARFPEGLLEV